MDTARQEASWVKIDHIDHKFKTCISRAGPKKLAKKFLAERRDIPNDT